MNNVRFLCIGEGVAAVVCACDVIPSKSSVGSIGLPSTVESQRSASSPHDKMHESGILWIGEGCGSNLCFVAGESASAHHDKMHESRTPWTWRRAWQLSTLVGVGDARKGVGIVVTSART